MTARQYVKMLGARQTWDSDYDLDARKVTKGKMKGLKKFGFKVYQADIGIGIHIHAPMRKVKSWFDRGWGWQLGVKAT